MTTYTRTGRPVTARATGHYLHRDHTVTGTPAQLANLVANHRNAGTFVAMTAPRPITGNRFQVIIRLREPQPTTPAATATALGERTRSHVRVSRRTRIAAVIAAVTGTLAGLVAVAAYLLGQLVELIAAHAGPILAVLALAAILAGLTTRSRTGRRHCPGC